METMDRSSFALFVALLIHLIIFLLFWMLLTIIPITNESLKPKENKIKISLKEMPKKQKIIKQQNAEVIKKKVEPSFIAPPMPKGSQLKKIVKIPKIKDKPKTKPTTKIKPKIIKKQKLSKQKKVIKSIIKEKKSKQEIIVIKKKIKQIKSEIALLKKQAVEKQNEKPKNPLYSLLSEDKSSQEKKKKEIKIVNGGNINQNIKELYGDKFGELTKGQQEYILDNQEIMRRITQQILTRVASVNISKDLRINRTNIIEFYLHPSGDMTDFKFLKKSGYFILDNTTKETIEYSYSRYPRPTEKTLIRYNVYYNLAY